MDKKYWEETDKNMFTESWLKHYGHIEHPFNKACFSHTDIALMEWDKHQLTLQLATTKAELERQQRLNEHFACKTCGGIGVVGSPPDDYYDCPKCKSYEDLKAELEESRKANKRQPPCEQFCESRAFKSTIAKLEKELDKIKNHLAIEESECVRLCNEKNKFKAELQAERAKAGDLIQEISVLRQYGNKDCTAMADEYLESLKPKGNNNA